MFLDTLIVDGDHAVDGRGLPQSITGERELIQRILLRLGIRKGSFALDPRLGSELHKINPGQSPAHDRLALGYAQEALAPVPGVEVLAARCRIARPGEFWVELDINMSGKKYAMEVQVA